MLSCSTKKLYRQHADIIQRLRQFQRHLPRLFGNRLGDACRDDADVENAGSALDFSATGEGVDLCSRAAGDNHRNLDFQIEHFSSTQALPPICSQAAFDFVGSLDANLALPS